jgi:hypothetical protein
LAANTSPVFTNIANLGVVTISTANANRDGTGTMGTVLTAGANGSRIGQVVITAQGTTTAGMIRLFIHNGTTAFLYKEVAVTAITPSSTVQAFTATVVFPNGLVLPTGYTLRASTHNAESFNVVAEGGNY